MKVVQIPNGVFAENCYLVVDEQARECAIIDPGEEAGLILHKVEETGARPVAIWLTHAHLDHVLGVARVARETGASIWLHPADRPLYDAVPDQVAWFGLAQPEGGPLPAPDAEMVPGQRLRVRELVAAALLVARDELGPDPANGARLNGLVAALRGALESVEANVSPDLVVRASSAGLAPHR